MIDDFLLPYYWISLLALFSKKTLYSFYNIFQNPKNNKIKHCETKLRTRNHDNNSPIISTNIAIPFNHSRVLLQGVPYELMRTGHFVTSLVQHLIATFKESRSHCN